MAVVPLASREAGTGTPLVLLHAFPLSSAMWLEQRELLGSRCRVITPDQRGFGGSELGSDEPAPREVPPAKWGWCEGPGSPRTAATSSRSP